MSWTSSTARTAALTAIKTGNHAREEVPERVQIPTATNPRTTPNRASLLA